MPGLFGDIYNMFKGISNSDPSGAAQNPTSTAANTNSVNPQQVRNPDPNAQNNPAAFSNTPAATGSESPLDNYGKIWETKTQDSSNEPVFNVDPAKLQEAASKANFTSNIPKELTAKALSGDQDALMQVINLSNQNVFAQSAHAMTAMIDKALETKVAELQKTLPQQMKHTQVAESLAQENPVFSHPATAPLLQSLTKQLQASYPTASAQELQQHAKDYLGEFIKIAQGKPSEDLQTGTTRRGSGNDDWSFLERM